MTLDELKKFCGRDKYRSYLLEPFSRGEHTYATDGNILIRIPRLAEIGEVTGAPNTEKIFNENFKGIEGATSVPIAPQADLKRCRTCDRTGKVTECSECGGDGALECDLGHEHECEDCDGTGYIASTDDQASECPDCQGVGKVPDLDQGIRAGVVINRSHCVAYRYLRVISLLPSAKWNLTNGREEHDPIPFWFDGGEGMVMPMRFHGGAPSPNYLYVEEQAA